MKTNRRNPKQKIISKQVPNKHVMAFGLKGGMSFTMCGLDVIHHVWSGWYRLRLSDALLLHNMTEVISFHTALKLLNIIVCIRVLK